MLFVLSRCGRRGRTDGAGVVARLNIDEYMSKLQETALRALDHVRLRNPEIMFRAVDTEHLVPRHRVEMGVMVGGTPVLAITMREKDPCAAGEKLAAYVNGLLDKVAQ